MHNLGGRRAGHSIAVSEAALLYCIPGIGPTGKNPSTPSAEKRYTLRQAVGAGRRANVLVNNRAEGNAPLTVQGLVGMLRGSIGAVGADQSSGGVLTEGEGGWV